jgi:DNA-directed RNA polymerase subunit RPC12/RpoP
MADIEFTCSECGQTLEAPEEMAGESLACPECEAPITIPAPQTETEEGNAGIVFQNIEEAEVDEPYAETAANACPECGAELGDGVVLCVQCGFHLKLGKKIATEFD